MSCTFPILVTSRKRRSGITLGVDGIVRVRVTAPPVDGAANEAVIELLAKVLGVGKRSLTLVAGEKGRNKQVSVEGLTWEAVAHRIKKS